MKPYTVSVKKFDQAYFEDIAKYSIEIFRLNVGEHQNTQKIPKNRIQ